MAHSKKLQDIEMICPLCGELIGEDDAKFMYASDRPYRNIWVHRRCYLEREGRLSKDDEEVLNG